MKIDTNYESGIRILGTNLSVIRIVCFWIPWTQHLSNL